MKTNVFQKLFKVLLLITLCFATFIAMDNGINVEADEAVETTATNSDIEWQWDENTVYVHRGTTITEEMLKFYTKNSCFESEKGEFEVFIDNSSKTDNKAIFKLI